MQENVEKYGKCRTDEHGKCKTEKAGPNLTFKSQNILIYHFISTEISPIR